MGKDYSNMPKTFVNKREMLRVDLNADIGECPLLQAPEKSGAKSKYSEILHPDEAELLSVITSANIACGYHAGDHKTMAVVVRAAAECNVAIGAHPSLPDRAGFGRRELKVHPDEVFDMLVYQIGALYGFAKAAKRPLTHVKPHGALYHMAEKDHRIAAAIVRAVKAVDIEAAIMALSGGQLASLAEDHGVRVFHEVFADRAYNSDGSLVSRVEPNALVTDPEIAANRIAHLLDTGMMETAGGKMLPLRADTICIHGDTPDSIAITKAIAKRLTVA